MPTTAAVIGASTPVGRAVLVRAARAAGLDRVLAVDGQGVPMAPPAVEVRVMDHRDRLLPLALEGVDVLVHCAAADDVAASPDALYGANVGGTRNVLDAAGRAGVRHLVVISSAMAYGAHPDNPVPLREDAPLRANPGFAYGYQRQLVEEVVQGWGASHPSTTVTILRCAPVMGGGSDTAVARRLQAPRFVVPTGQAAPLQFVHVDDVASAVDLVIADDLGGVFNVAADGWLDAEEVAACIGRPVLAVGQSTLTEVLRSAHRVGLSPAPPEIMPYLLHPWVLDAGLLRAHGWQAQRTNRDVLTAFAAEHGDVLALGRLTASRTQLHKVGLGLAAVAGITVLRVVRR